MKYIIFFLLLPFEIFSQKSYRIDEIKSGGYYLVELARDTSRGIVTESPQRFNTPEQLTAYVTYLREKAAKDLADVDVIKANAQAEAKKIIEKAASDAEKLRATVPETNGMADKIEAAGKEFFNPKPAPAPAPAKPPKKADKKKKQ